jgi:hypothetical protein
MNPTLAELLTEAIESRIALVHTALPGIIQSYDPATQLADVTPSIKKKYRTGEVKELPKLSKVPVMFARTSTSFLHFEPKKDDPCLLIFCERSLDIWRSKGGTVDPKDARKHDLSDAVAILGLRPDGDKIVPDGTVELREGELALMFKDGKGFIAKTTSATENLVLGQELKTYLAAVHEQLEAILDVLIAGTHVLTTSPGNPTAPNPAEISKFAQAKADLAALKASPVDDDKLLSDIWFTEKGA